MQLRKQEDQGTSSYTVAKEKMSREPLWNPSTWKARGPEAQLEAAEKWGFLVYKELAPVTRSPCTAQQVNSRTCV